MAVSFVISTYVNIKPAGGSTSEIYSTKLMISGEASPPSPLDGVHPHHDMGYVVELHTVATPNLASPVFNAKLHSSYSDIA